MAKKKKTEFSESDVAFEEANIDDLINKVVSSVDGAKILDPSTIARTQFVSTTNLALNRIISGRAVTGGIPLGRITQIKGPSSSAKTVIAMHCLQGVQRIGGIGVLLDAEHAYSESFGKALGIDVNRLICAEKDTLEASFRFIIDIINKIREQGTKRPICIVYDSIAASPSVKETQEAVTAKKVDPDDPDSMQMVSEMGHRAKVCSQFLRIITPLIAGQNVALVIINQERKKVGAVYGNPNTTAGGGTALEYYCSVILDTKKKANILDGNLVVGVTIDVKVSKNKVHMPFREAEGINLFFDKGIDPASGLAEVLQFEGIGKKNSTGRLFVKDPNGVEVGFFPAKVGEFVTQNPWVLGPELRWNEKESRIESVMPTQEEVQRILNWNKDLIGLCDQKSTIPAEEE